MPTIRHLMGVILIAAAALAPQVARAQFWVNEQGWIVTVSANAIWSPQYIGSNVNSFGGWPSFTIRRAQDEAPFIAADDGVSLALFGSPMWSVGLVGRYQSGRYYGDNHDLFGLEDVKWSVQPGIFGEIWPIAKTLRVRGELRVGINGFSGLVGNLSADVVHRWNQFTFYTGPRVGFGGSNYMQSYFSVTPEEAAINNAVLASGLTPYKASAGFSSLGWAAAVRYAYDDHWSGTLHVGYDRLVGSAADSPVTKLFGSENQFSVRGTISYAFFWSGFR